MDPIALDVPVKAPPSLGMGSRPPVSPPPRQEQPKQEQPRHEPTKPPFQAPAVTPPPQASLPGKVAETFGLQPTKKNLLVLAAAACSLVAGIAAVKMIFPGKKVEEASKPLVAQNSKQKEEPPKPEPETPKPPQTVLERSSEPTGGPVAPVYVPPTSPTFTPSVPPAPTYVPPTAPTYTPAPPSTPVYVPPTAPTYTPSTPTYTPSTPPYVPPVTPPAPPPYGVVPAIPEVPAATSKPGPGYVGIPQPETTVPMYSPPRVSTAGASEPVIPVIPPAPLGPPSVPPIGPPNTPTAPPASIPLPDLPAIPSMSPPATPMHTTVPPTMPPATLPMVPGITPPTIAPPTITPPAITPPSIPPTTPGMLPPATIDYSKFVGSSEVKPAATPDRAAQTSFDVDLHEPKNGDTYATISKEFYNDAKYATALQEYNLRRPLQTSVRVEVPPIHVLKKKYPQLIGTVVPAAATKTGDGWSSAGDTSPAFRPTGQRTFTVPTGGMTMGAIARDTLGSVNRWRDIYDINPSLSPGDLLPAGTVVKIPTEVKPNN